MRKKGSPSLLSAISRVTVRFETHDGALSEAIQAVFCFTLRDARRPRCVAIKAVFRVRFGTHEDTYAAVHAVFVRFGTQDGARTRGARVGPLCKVVHSVKARLSFLKRGVRQHASHASADSVYAQSALRLGAFLRQVAPSGPTAGVSVSSALRWWRATLGVPLPVDDELLRSFRQLDVSHTPRSAPVPLPFGGVVHVRLAAAPLGFERQPASSVLSLVETCIRWRHAQQFVLEGVSGTFGRRAVASGVLVYCARHVVGS